MRVWLLAAQLGQRHWANGNPWRVGSFALPVSGKLCLPVESKAREDVSEPFGATCSSQAGDCWRQFSVAGVELSFYNQPSVCLALLIGCGILLLKAPEALLSLMDNSFPFFPFVLSHKEKLLLFQGEGGRQGGRDREEDFFCLAWDVCTSPLPALSYRQTGLLLVWQRIPALTKPWKVRENNYSSPFN